jgi:hypothetical protein
MSQPKPGLAKESLHRQGAVKPAGA